MNTTCLLSAVLGSTAMVVAQTNPFVFFPQDPERQTITCATFVGRPDWNNQGEGHQEVGAEWFRGVGGTDTICQVTGFYHWGADENVSTSETYGIILRSADPGGMIDTTAAGEILRVSPLTLPTNAAGGRGSWIMTDTFTTPVAVPCTDSWFMGIDFPANPAWPASDGHSYWRADTAAVTAAGPGENPRAGAPDANWTVQTGGNFFSNGWSTIMGVMVDAPTLHVGGFDPNNSRQGTGATTTQSNLGLGGLFPDISGAPRSDGITLRAHDNSAPNGVAIYAGALTYDPPLGLPGLGQFHLSLTGNIGLGIVVMNGGAAELQAFAPGSINPSFVGVELRFQALVANAAGVGRFTNTQTTFF